MKMERMVKTALSKLWFAYVANRFPKRLPTVFLCLCAAPLVLSGCVAGTTFGTGVTQEQQLIQDIEGMVSLGSKRKKARLDYSQRPELVIPANTQALPDPEDQASTTSNVDWPENPEQRLARIRSEAEEADPRSGEISVEELKRKKVGIRQSNNYGSQVTDRDGHQAINELKSGEYKKAQMLKKKLAYSNGPNRKYLTEPPNLYRTPVGTAPVGDLGISEAEKERRAEKVAKRKRAEDTGMWTGNE